MASMIARTTLLITKPRFGRTTLVAALTTATALGGSSMVKYSQCQDVGLKTNFQPTGTLSLVVPTVQAGLRAIRLVRTVVLMVLDYEMAKAKPLIFASDIGDEDKKIHQLEQRLERHESELEDAQLEYARETTAEEKKMTPQERKAFKTEQKEAMHRAASQLAETEDEITLMEGSSVKSQLHRKAAHRILQLCRENGGVYIKVGQHLANLDYLVPQEYIEVLSSLFDEAPRSDYHDVCRVIEEELNGCVDELFDRFDPEPIASASLAQVHVAYDKKTGKKLAVKVQHAGLRETAVGDVFAVTSVVRFIDRLFQDFTFGWIADEIAPHLPRELDFVREGKNAERAAAHIEESGLNCVVPKVIWNSTSARVLTMEFEEGFKSTDLESIEESGLNKHDVAKLISSVFNSQVFLSAWVHCDPHPANVLLRSKNGKPQMVLVDHGLYKEIDDDFRLRYAQLWRSLMMADLKGIETSCHGLGIDKAYPLFAAMLTARPYDEIIERSKTGSFSAPCSSPESQADRAVIRGYAKQFLKDIFVLLGILPRQMLLLLKMNDCLRHIDFALGSPTNTLVVAGKYASQAVYNNETSCIEATISSRCRSWLRYMKVLFRIQVHDFGSWILRTSLGRSMLGSS